MHMQIHDIEDFVRGRRAAFLHFQYDIAPDHQRSQRLLGRRFRICMAGDRATPQHNDLIAYFQHFL